MSHQWSSHFRFILAAASAAVGLGNIWKFPYITGEHGGGAFVLLYLLCIVLIGLPLLLAEVGLGRLTQQNPVMAMQTLINRNHLAKGWGILGHSCLWVGFIILSYYSVISGWTLHFTTLSICNAFDQASSAHISALFADLLNSPGRMLLWHTAVMAMCAWVVSLKLQSGLERVVTYIFPFMLLLLMLLIGYNLVTAEFKQALIFLFKPSFGALNTHSILVALGHAFFTLSLVMGSMLVYGAYLPGEKQLFRSVLWIALLDTSIALLAGLAIFPIVFAFALEPAAGPGLLFVTLPVALGQMPGGLIVGTLFLLTAADTHPIVVPRVRAQLAQRAQWARRSLRSRSRWGCPRCRSRRPRSSRWCRPRRRRRGSR